MQLDYTMEVNNGTIQLKFGNGTVRNYNFLQFPTLFLEWQSLSRTRLFDLIREKGTKSIRMQPAHLPVLATLGDGDFSINLANKGLGMLPKESLLEKYVSIFEKALNETKDFPWDKSIFQRMKVVEEFYKNTENFNTYLLGGLEIFEGQTFSNLQKNPKVSLLFTGEAPKFPSYQFNGIIKIMDRKNPYFKFLLAARELFAHDPFHVKQTVYPFGYLFYSTEIKDKTPYPRIRKNV
jgi:hypothetical protein